MTDLPAAAITAGTNAAAVWAERTLMSAREVGYQPALITAALEAAAPHIAIAERERIRRAITTLAYEIDRIPGLTPDDRIVVAETLRQLAADLDKLAEGDTT